MSIGKEGSHAFVSCGGGARCEEKRCARCGMRCFSSIRGDGVRITAFAFGEIEPLSWVVPEEAPPCRAPSR